VCLVRARLLGEEWLWLWEQARVSVCRSAPDTLSLSFSFALFGVVLWCGVVQGYGVIVIIVCVRGSSLLELKVPGDRRRRRHRRP
jgi:hypothetical protein